MIKKYYILTLALILMLIKSSYSKIFVYIDDSGNIYMSDKKNNNNYTKVSDYNFKKDNNIFPEMSDIKYNSVGYYKRLIKRVSKKNNISYHIILAIVKNESNFDRFAVSAKGACGLMQLMPATASDYHVTDIFDAYQNINAGVEYYKTLYKRFKSHKLALAAYNAGPQNVLKYKNSIPPYPETKKYVKKVLDYYNYIKWRKPVLSRKVKINDKKDFEISFK